MTRARVIAGLLLLPGLAAWLLVAPVSHGQDRSVTVDGQVVNGTPDGDTVSGLTVVLHVESATTSDVFEATTDEGGRFEFNPFVYDSALLYELSVLFHGATYGTNLDLSAESGGSISLTVYDAAGGDDILNTVSASVMFAGADEDAQTMSVVEITSISNASARTYVPGPVSGKPVWFGLPAGAQDLRVDTQLLGADFLLAEEGFALLASVPPGEHEVIYTYELPYTSDTVVFEKRFPYGADTLRVVAQYDSPKLASKQLGEPQVINMGGRPFQLLATADLPREARISVELSGLPRHSLRQKLDRRLDEVRFEYVAPAGLVLFMVLLIGYALWRRPHTGQGSEADPPADTHGDR